MSADPFHALEEFFHGALRLPPEEREAFIRERCAHDTRLAEEVRELLAFHGPDEAPAAPTPEAPATPAPPRPPPARFVTLSDRYRLVRPLGEGTFGVVHLAEQTQPVRRTVAVKLIKPGMDSASVISRFESERQTLAVMDHPGIAKIFDGGVTERGLPFFAMEYVEGEPITHFCDRRTMGIADRLALFRRVCEAAAHAHSKGIVHRDLKPANVLVQTAPGADPQPKIIDFGISRALGPAAETAMHQTLVGRPIGTPGYMSPEQALGSADIDTRTDIYALGAILYELLSGTMPAPSTGTGSSSGPRAHPLPARSPSSGFRALARAPDGAAQAERIAAARASTPGALPRLLRGDLDAVTLMCLEQQRERRYATVRELAEDLRRHLAAEPVQAAPPTALYRASRFVRRHRTGVLAATGAVLGLVVSVLVLWVALVETGRARDEARARFYQASLAAAEGALRNGNVTSARRHLEAVPPAQRAWEWRLLAGGLDGSEGVVVRTTEQVRNVSLELCPSADMLVVAYGWSSVHIHDLSTGRLRRVIDDAQQRGMISLTPDGSRLATVADVGAIRLWDTATGEQVAATMIRDGLPTWLVALSADGQRLYLTSHGGVRGLDVAPGTLKQVWRLDDPDQASSALDVSPDGRLVASTAGREVVVLDARSGATVRSFPAEMIHLTVTFSPDGKRLAYVDHRDGDRLSIRALDTGEEEVGLWLEGRMYAMEYSPDGRFLCLGDIDGRIHVIDIEARRRTGLLLGHSGLVHGLAFLPATGDLYSASYDGTVRRWRLPPTGLPYQLVVDRDSTNKWASMALSQSGKLLAASSGPHVFVWKTADIVGAAAREKGRATGEVRPLLEVLDAHGGRQVAGVGFDREEERVLSAGEDGALRSHDLANGAEAPVLFQGARGRIGTLKGVGPGGEALVMVSGRGAERIDAVMLVDARSGKATELELDEKPRGIQRVAFLGGVGGRVLALCEDHRVIVWERATGARCAEAEVRAGEVVPILDRGGMEAMRGYLLIGQLTRLAGVEAEGVSEPVPWDHNKGALIAVSPDGARVAISMPDGIMRIWDAHSGRHLLGLETFAHLNQLEWTQDGDSLIGVGDGPVSVWVWHAPGR